MAIKLLIVDDHPMVREGLSAMLGTSGEIEVVGSCSNSKDAITMSREENPDIILMDIKMEEISGIEITRQILDKNPHIRIIFLTVFEDSESIRQALQSGASGYILKHISQEKLIDTIKRVFQGETVIDPSVFNQIVNDYARLSKKASAGREEPSTEKEALTLTPREHEVLKHLVKGLTNKEISTATNLAIDTVKTHLRNIFRKLGVKNRSQAISRAIKISKELSYNQPFYNKAVPPDSMEGN